MAIPQNTATATLTIKVADQNALITAINAELALLATKAQANSLEARVAALEAKPAPVDLTERVTALEDEPAPVIPPDLSERVAAIEATVASYSTTPSPTGADPMTMPVIPHTRRGGPDEVELIYDKATLYYGDLEMHALRIAEDTWRLVAQLNYITVSQVIWTYDETVTGTVDDIYRHAVARLEELAELKVAHDAAHDRVRRMSEGET